MKFRHLSLEERKKIQEMLGKGYTFTRIGKELGRTDGTILNEVKKNGGPTFYDAEKAQQKAKQNVIDITEKSRKMIMEKREANRAKRFASLEQRMDALEEKLLQQQGESYVNNEIDKRLRDLQKGKAQ